MQLNGLGFSFIEVVSACPTNWKLSPVESLEHIKNNIQKVHKLGIFKDITKKESI